MAGTHINNIGWFLRDSFYKKVPDNSVNLIIKWYLRFLRNPEIYDQILNEIKSEKEKARAQIDTYFGSIIEPKKELKKFEELKNTEEEEIFMDGIRDFILKRRIKRHQIVEMTGLSVDTIQKFFTKNTTFLNHTKWLMYRWFLRYSKHPQIFHQAFSITDINMKQKTLQVQSIDNNVGSQSATGE
jgi:hypothetical protein